MRENTKQSFKSALQGISEALGAHLSLFSSFFVSSTRDATAIFYGYLRGLFQPERSNMLRMSEVDHQAMQHMLTSSAIDWNGFGERIARETDALLGGLEAILIIDESGFARKGEASAGFPGNGMGGWARWTIARWVYLPACARTAWPV
jgi:hypothetical protein